MQLLRVAWQAHTVVTQQGVQAGGQATMQGRRARQAGKASGLVAFLVLFYYI